MIAWLRRLHSGPRRHHVPVAESLEARLLFSADLGGVLAAGVDPAAAEVRTLDSAGEYAAMAAVAADEAPVAVSDAFTTAEDDKLILSPSDLLGNDTDLEGAELSIVSVGDATNGTVRLNGNGVNGTVQFEPAPDFHGTATFTYVVTDGVNETTGTVTITVTPVNDPPVTTPVSLPGMAEDGGTILITPAGLLANASDVEGDPLTLTGLVANSGTLVANADGTWSFTPAADFNGTVTFSYAISDGAADTPTTATLVVAPVNDPPSTLPVTLPAMAEDGTIV
ncbi:MAG: tandem-95 repeat protein, partial [Comamonadaceae bacterium]